jgi:hypothetical protein
MSREPRARRKGKRIGVTLRELARAIGQSDVRTRMPLERATPAVQAPADMPARIILEQLAKRDPQPKRRQRVRGVKIGAREALIIDHRPVHGQDAAAPGANARLSGARRRCICRLDRPATVGLSASAGRGFSG